MWVLAALLIRSTWRISTSFVAHMPRFQQTIRNFPLVNLADTALTLKEPQQQNRRSLQTRFRSITMKKFILPLIAAMAVATPAMANEGRVEVRGGVVWANGSSQDTWGAAAGYDFDLGSSAFAGVEVSGDKIGSSGSQVAFGGTARLGVKAGTGTRLFAAGGYTTEACSSCGGQWHLGAGAEQKVSGPVYVKAEYRHYFDNSTGIGEFNALVAGVGIRF
jgi:outer membrane immunogenic protein